MEEFRDGVSGVDDDRVQDVGNTSGPIVGTGSGAVTNLAEAVGGDTSSE